MIHKSLLKPLNKIRQPLIRVGAIAALLAALLFRRNMGAEVTLFIGAEAIPKTAAEWFVFLLSDPIIGLTLLAFLDLANSILIVMIFLALSAAHWPANKSMAAIALLSGLMGIALNIFSNISLTMLSFSMGYASAITEAQQANLLAAGDAALAGSDPLTAIPSTGALISLLLISLAGLLFSIMLLPSHRTTAITGLLASGCDLVYCLVFHLTPIAPVYLLLAAAGLFWMLWHLMVARFFFQRWKEYC